MLGLAHSHGLLGEAAPDALAGAELAAAAEAALRPFLHEHSAAFYHELRHACFARCACECTANSRPYSKTSSQFLAEVLEREAHRACECTANSRPYSKTSSQFLAEVLEREAEQFGATGHHSIACLSAWYGFFFSNRKPMIAQSFLLLPQPRCLCCRCFAAAPYSVATYDRVVQYERAPAGPSASSSAAPSQCPPAPAAFAAPSAAPSGSAAGGGRGRGRNPGTDPGPVPGAARVPTSEWLLWAARRGGKGPSHNPSPALARPAADSAGPAAEAPPVGAVHVHLHLHEHRHRHSRGRSQRGSSPPEQRQNRHDRAAGSGAEEARSSGDRASSKASPLPESRHGKRGGRGASPQRAAADEHGSRKRPRSRSRDSRRRRRLPERLAPCGRRSPARCHAGEESAGRDDATVSRGFSRKDAGTGEVADELAELRARALRAVAAQKGSRGSGNA